MKELTELDFDSTTRNGAVLIDFTAEWCGPCKVMVPVLTRLSTDYAGRLGVFSVDIDKCPVLAARHGVMSVPTMLLFTGGKAVERIVGAVSEKDLRKKIDQHLGAVSGH
jgi:thioredoxin 1